MTRVERVIWEVISEWSIPDVVDAVTELVAAGGAGDGVDALAVDRQRQDGALPLQADPLRSALEAVGHARQDASLDNLNRDMVSKLR